MLTWWLVLAACVVGAYGACPQHCSCFTDPDGYNSANCSTLALGGVQPSSLDLLSLQPHQPGYPTKLAPRAFQSFRRVKFLWAVNCSVLNLPNDVFHGLDYVIKMDLSYNKIRHLNGIVFKPLGSLHTLLLRGNPLFLNPWDVIVSDSLQELDLGHCGLRNIPQGTFISTPRLSRLSLDGNEIHTFTFNTIPAGLRYLNLAHNRIINVPTDVLTAMSYLRKLDLSKNPIKCNCYLLIMQDWFSGQGIIFENGVTCAEPSQYAGQHLSKINENELCTLEEKKRERRINDIESYRDSKAHRTHNMIHDPDLQSDQPADLYSEVLFDDEGTRALGTHMELSNHHYPLPSDLSDENNKLAASKHGLAPTEAHIALPTKEIKQEENGEIAGLLEEKINLNNSDTSDEISTEDLSIVNSDSISRTLTAESHTRNISEHILEEQLPLNVTSESIISNRSQETMPTNSPENEMADEGYSPLYTSTPPSMVNNKENFHSHNDSYLELSDQAYDLPHNISGQEHEMADEGYSPVFNTTDVMLDDEVGSGDDVEDIDTKDASEATVLVHDGNTSTPATYTWPSSHSDTSDYNYEDTHHDYSVEAGPSTEAMSTAEVEEGSGDVETDSVDRTSTSLPPYVDDDNETSTEGYHMIETSTDLNVTSESTTESYGSSSLGYSSSSESVTEEEVVETELVTEPSTTLTHLSSESSVASSSSEASSSSSEPTTEATFISSSSEPEAIITDATSSSTESSSSSSPDWPIKIVENEETTAAPTAESTTVEPPIASDVEVISRSGKENEKEQIVDGPMQAESETGRTDLMQSTLTYIVAGLLVGLILLVLVTVMCRKVSKMRRSASKTKVRLPHDTEANLGTEMQDMLLPKPPENGVKIIPQNGTHQNGKEVKEEEVPVLQKDWDEKPEPIETVTARMSVLEGPKTPVFIHKTLT